MSLLTRRGLLLLALLLGWVGCAHGPASVARDLALSQQSLWTCRCAATSIAAGHDAAGEGQRLWIAADNKVFEVRPDGAVAEVWVAPRFSRVLRLEPVDLDADGSDEWIVLLDTGRMRSRVIALRDGSRVAVGKPWNGYLRPGRDRSGSTVLYGQRTGGDRPFLGPVFRVEVADDLSLKSGDPLDLPRDFPLFDFFWLSSGADESPRLFSLEPNGLVAERNADSPRQVLWLSDARFVARPLQVEREYRGMLGDHRDGVVELAPPVVLSGGGDSPERAYVVSQPPRGPVVVEGFVLPRGGGCPHPAAGSARPDRAGAHPPDGTHPGRPRSLEARSGAGHRSSPGMDPLGGRRRGARDPLAVVPSRDGGPAGCRTGAARGPGGVGRARGGGVFALRVADYAAEDWSRSGSSRR